MSAQVPAPAGPPAYPHAPGGPRPAPGRTGVRRPTAGAAHGVSHSGHECTFTAAPGARRETLPGYRAERRMRSQDTDSRTKCRLHRDSCRISA